jgi:hypothetical protein
VREGYEFYDITAWSLPVAFGVEAYWTADAAPIAATRSRSPPARRRRRRAAPVRRGRRHRGRRARAVGLPVPPDRSGASRLAFHLLAADFRVGVATEPVEAGGQQWPRGTFVVRVSRNDASLHARLDSLARASGVDVTPVNSAFTETAQFGIGGGEVVSLARPRVAIVGDEGIAQTSFGALWWTFERRYDVDFTHLNWGALGGNLSRYNVLIIPDGSAGAIGERMGRGGVDRLKAWVRAGGTLITMATHRPGRRARTWRSPARASWAPTTRRAPRARRPAPTPPRRAARRTRASASAPRSRTTCWPSPAPAPRARRRSPCPAATSTRCSTARTG